MGGCLSAPTPSPAPSHHLFLSETSFIYLFAEPLTSLKGAFVHTDNQCGTNGNGLVFEESLVCVSVGVGAVA